MVLKFIYTLFLALLVALFVGLGISAFYPGPKEPDYPIALEAEKPGCEDTAELKTIREKYNLEQREFERSLKNYSKNVSIIALCAAILILVASLALISKINMIADGVLLGGVFTATYSIVRGFMSENSKFRFLVVTVGLLIAFILGYIKFIQPIEKKKNN